MRERRHQSGNSNTPRPASAREPVVHAKTVATGPQAQRGGATTVRRPDVGESCTSRRIHSARAERPRGALATAEPSPHLSQTFRTRKDERDGTSTLPQLHMNPLPVESDPIQWAVKVSPQPPARPAARAASSREAGGPSSCTADLAAPALRDFSALLRDRYDGKRSLRLAFLNWDRDKDGQLSLQEIRDMIHTLGLAKTLGRARVDVILDHVAARPSRSLRYEDFSGFVYGSQADPCCTASATSKNQVDASSQEQPRIEPQDEEQAVQSSAQALYPDVAHVVNLLRRKYETRQLRQAFRHWDADKDGCITLQELELNLRRQGVKLPQSQLRELFDQHDTDKDGRLLYQEFVHMICGPIADKHHNPALQAHLREVAKQENQLPDPYQILKTSVLQEPGRRFDDQAICTDIDQKLQAFAPHFQDAAMAFHDDHSGKLSYPEFRQGLNTLGLHFTHREFLHLASMVDTGGSGAICFREFNNHFRPRRSKPHQSANAAAAESESVQQRSSDPALLAKQQTKLPQAPFDFAHLTRRARVATRHGRNPFPNTKDLLSSTNGDLAHHQHENNQRFRTETSMYGASRTARQAASQNQNKNISDDSGSNLTLGQEEKQRKDANYARRLERLREAQHAYDKLTAPRVGAHDARQQRRAETIHRQQQQYQTSVEEQRPHQQQQQAQSPHSPQPSRQQPT